jgi:hypothetical protein
MPYRPTVLVCKRDLAMPRVLRQVLRYQAIVLNFAQLMIPSAKPASNVKENHTDLFKRSVLFVVKRSLFVAVLLFNDYDRHALFQCCQVVD